MFDLKELATIAGISRQRLQQLRKEGRGPSTMEIGVGHAKRVFVPEFAAIRWLQDRYPERAEAFIRLQVELA
jgi:hypothetical protein